MNRPRPLLSKKMNVIATTLLFSLLFSPTFAAEQPEVHFITIGTATLHGTYHPIGHQICIAVNKSRDQHNIRCSVEATEGSVYNLHTVRSKELELALAQSDRHHNAYHGDAQFESRGPFAELRSLFSLNKEPFTLVVHRESGIKSFNDLKDKQVNIGKPGSGSYATMYELMARYKMDEDDFKALTSLETMELSEAICNRKIDAMILTTGHPHQLLADAMQLCDLLLVEISGEPVDQLVKERPYYDYATIPGGIYPGNPQPTKTFGVVATLVSHSSVDPTLVYNIVKALFDNLDTFKQHSLLTRLNPQEMVHDGLTAPLHQGALRYYREKGLIDE